MAKDAYRPPSEALTLAIASADLYMSAFRDAGRGNPSRRAALRKKFEEMVTLAERLKARDTGQGNTGVQTRQITRDEQKILERSSRLHGNNFQPWRSDPSDSVFALSAGQEAYV